ncbi:MAG: hypothetical protein K0R17_1669 [Rariglobus sp.]|jgi:hypothetical protein|nr:hypothetical protein [Rariglobus sp.]
MTMKNQSTMPAGKPFRHRALWVTFAIVVGLLLFVRFAASPIVTKVVNRKLSALPDYTGRVEAVNLALWRGTANVKNFTLETRKSPEDGPMVKVRRATVSIAWAPLFRGKFGGQALVEDAEFTIFNDIAIPEDKKSGEQKHEEREGKVAEMREWQGIMREAFPLEISRFELRNAQLRYVDRTVESHPEIAMEQVGIVATGLRNRHEERDAKNENLPAHVTFDASVKTGGRIAVEIWADPIADQPRFKVNMEVKGLELTPLNGLLRTYTKTEAERGRFEVFAEITAEGGRYQGYLKPFFEDLEFHAVREEKFLKRAATAVTNAVAAVLKNENEKTATQVPIEGNFTDNRVDIWETIRNLLRNAFVQALREGFAGQTPSD